MYIFRKTGARLSAGALVDAIERLWREAGGYERNMRLLLTCSALECGLSDFWGAGDDDLSDDPADARALLAELLVESAGLLLGIEGACARWTQRWQALRHRLRSSGKGTDAAPGARPGDADKESTTGHQRNGARPACAPEQWDGYPQFHDFADHALRNHPATSDDNIDRLLLDVAHPEGFRFYALRPEAYAEPARRWAAVHGQRAGCAWVIGLRTIGSTLGAVVTAVLRQCGITAQLLTLRPRGSPFDRHYAVSGRVNQRLRASGARFLIADEGPGLSGSSFGGAVRWLEGLGIASASIALMPSWDPPAERLSHTVVAARWAGFEKFAATPPQPPVAGALDLSAGQWRAAFPPALPVPVWAQQERAKFLDPSGQVLFKYAGLGDYGREAFQRSRLLARAGVTVAAAYEGDGWLRMPRLQAQPLLRQDFQSAAWAEWAGNYLAFRSCELRLRESLSEPAPELRLMAETNVRLLTGHEWRRAAEMLPGPVTLVDGRMLPQEFAWHQGRCLKFDAIDHCDDHFFPGPSDPAWDLAMVRIELGHPVAEAVMAQYVRRSGDIGVHQRLPWYLVAYAAFRCASAEFAQELVGEPDQQWFLAIKRRTLRQLHSLAEIPSATVEAEAA